MWRSGLPRAGQGDGRWAGEKPLIEQRCRASWQSGEHQRGANNSLANCNVQSKWRTHSGAKKRLNREGGNQAARARRKGAAGWVGAWVGWCRHSRLGGWGGGGRLERESKGRIRQVLERASGGAAHGLQGKGSRRCARHARLGQVGARRRGQTGGAPKCGARAMNHSFRRQGAGSQNSVRGAGSARRGTTCQLPAAALLGLALGQDMCRWVAGKGERGCASVADAGGQGERCAGHDDTTTCQQCGPRVPCQQLRPR